MSSTSTVILSDLDDEKDVDAYLDISNNESTVREYDCMKKFPCYFCHKSYRYQRSLSEHFIDRHLYQRYICSYCDKAFVNCDDLGKHLENYHHKKFLCEICNKFFSCKYSLDVHYTAKHTEKRFHCNCCLRKYQYKSSLQKHHISCHSDKRYKCFVCNRTYKDGRALRRHQRQNNHFEKEVESMKLPVEEEDVIRL